MEQFGKPTSNTLPTIVRSLKAAVTNALKTHPHVAPVIWQRGFHDHVVRNQASHDQIARYMLTNPERWQEDRFHHP